VIEGIGFVPIEVEEGIGCAPMEDRWTIDQTSVDERVVSK